MVVRCTAQRTESVTRDPTPPLIINNSPFMHHASQKMIQIEALLVPPGYPGVPGKTKETIKCEKYQISTMMLIIEIPQK